MVSCFILQITSIYSHSGLPFNFGISLRGRRAFKGEGKGDFWRERNARGTQGGREGGKRLLKEAIVFHVINIQQASIKILIVQSKKTCQSQPSSCAPRVSLAPAPKISFPFPFERLSRWLIWYWPRESSLNWTNK